MAGFSNHYLVGDHFSFLTRKVWVAYFTTMWGYDCYIFFRQAAETRTKGTVLDFFGHFKKDISLENH